MTTLHPRTWGRSIALCGTWMTLASATHGDTSNLRLGIESGVALPGAHQQYSGMLLPTTGSATLVGIAYRVLTWSPGGLPLSMSPPSSRAELDLTLEVGHTRFQPLGVSFEGWGGPAPSALGPSTLVTIIQGIQLGESLERNPRVTLLMGAGFTRVAMSDVVSGLYGYRSAGLRAWTSAFTIAARVQARLKSNTCIQLTARVVRIGGVQYDNSLMMVPVTLGFTF